MSERVNEDELAAVLDLDVRESIRYRLAVEVKKHRAANLAATEQIAAFIERVSLEWEHIPQVADAIAGVAGRVRRGEVTP